MLQAVTMLRALAGAADNGITPGAFAIERLTLLSLGFACQISGDDGRNSKVAVTYREKGEAEWRPKRG